jgi:hypothetical protein
MSILVRSKHPVGAGLFTFSPIALFLKKEGVEKQLSHVFETEANPFTAE